MNHENQKNNTLGILCAIGCETLYGLSYIFTKQATACASELALLGWRFFLGVLVMSLCVLLGFIKVNLKGKPLKPTTMRPSQRPSSRFLTIPSPDGRRFPICRAPFFYGFSLTTITREIQ